MAKSKKRVTKSEQGTSTPEPTETRVRRAEERQVNDRTLISKIVIGAIVLLGLYLLLTTVLGWGNQQSGDAANEGDDASQVEGDDSANTDNGADPSANKDSQQKSQSNGTAVRETDAEYIYTVGEGESYTTIARQAVASMGSDLTPAERVAAETKIVSDANAGLLNVGQTLTLSKDTVRAAIDWAKSLSAEQEAAWRPYADLVAWEVATK